MIPKTIIFAIWNTRVGTCWMRKRTHRKIFPLSLNKEDRSISFLRNLVRNCWFGRNCSCGKRTRPFTTKSIIRTASYIKKCQGYSIRYEPTKLMSTLATNWEILRICERDQFTEDKKFWKQKYCMSIEYQRRKEAAQGATMSFPK